MFKVRNHRLVAGNASVPFVKSPNVGGALKPQILVIHFTASGPGSDIAKYFTKPAAKVSAHLVIRRDGTVIQCVPFNVVGWHAGESRWIDKAGKTLVGLNSDSIGIEIENWGPLKKTGAGWLSWTEQPVDASKVIEARHKFGRPNGGWEVFTGPQIDATVEAAQAICEAYGIEEIVGHDDIAPGRKSDPGPAWPMESFQARVFGRKSDGEPIMIVRSASGLNIRTGPGAQHTQVKPKPLADGTRVLLLEAEGSWRYVSVLTAAGVPDFSGWVHGSYLHEA